MASTDVTFRYRTVTSGDYLGVVEAQRIWGSRGLVGSLSLEKVFFDHFGSTSIIAEDNDGSLVGFLIGFPSLDNTTRGHIHTIDVQSGVRKSGVGNNLVLCFAQTMVSRGVSELSCTIRTDYEEQTTFLQVTGFSPETRSTEPAEQEFATFIRPLIIPRSPRVSTTQAETVFRGKHTGKCFCTSCS